MRGGRCSGGGEAMNGGVEGGKKIRDEKGCQRRGREGSKIKRVILPHYKRKRMRE